VSATETEWAWVAGIIEGEGCIYVRERDLTLIIQMTDEDVLLRVAAIAGVGKVIPIAHHRTWQPTWKDAYRWQAHGTRAQEVLRRIYPLLGARRREKADEALAIEYRRPTDIRKMCCKRGHPLRGPGADVYVNPKYPSALNCRVCRRERKVA
jgi:hypothetical protein